MRRLAASLLCLAYLSLAPLCTSPAGHGAVHGHDIPERHAAESAPLPLSYHAAMYHSFTTALVAISLALAGLVLTLHPLAGIVPLPVAHTIRTGARVRAAGHPPDPLLRRLSLFAHAPPGVACA